MTRRTMTVAAAVGAFAAGAPGAAEAATERATAADGTEYVLESGNDLRRVAGRRVLSFGTAVNTPPADGTGPDRGDVGGAARAVVLELAPRRETVVGAYLECRPESGGSFVYGTAGAGVRRVVAVFADGRRVAMRRIRAPRSWNYGGSVFLAVRVARVGLLEIRGYDAAGRRVDRTEYRPAAPCRTSGEAQPPEPTFRDHNPDPDIVTGAVAADLGRAERAWRRADIESYDFELKVLCFCGPPAGRWFESRVRNGKAVGGTTTVRGLFRQIRRMIEDRPAMLEVQYGRHGVPTSIDVNPRLGITDDELTLLTRRFRAR